MLLRQVCASWTPNYSHHVEKLQNVLVITNSFVWKQRATAKANMSSHSALNILHHGKQFWKGCITIIIINTMVNCLTYKTQNNQVPFTMFSLNGIFDGELIFGIVLYIIFCLIGCCMVCPSLTVWVLYGSPKSHCLGSVWFAQVSLFGFCMVCPSLTVWVLYGSPKSHCLGSVWFTQVSLFGFCMVCPSLTVWVLYGLPKCHCLGSVWLAQVSMYKKTIKAS